MPQYRMSVSAHGTGKIADVQPVDVQPKAMSEKIFMPLARWATQGESGWQE
jgi:hypothetical protein